MLHRTIESVGGFHNSYIIKDKLGPGQTMWATRVQPHCPGSIMFPSTASLIPPSSSSSSSRQQSHYGPQYPPPFPPTNHTFQAIRSSQSAPAPAIKMEGANVMQTVSGIINASASSPIELDDEMVIDSNADGNLEAKDDDDEAAEEENNSNTSEETPPQVPIPIPPEDLPPAMRPSPTAPTEAQSAPPTTEASPKPPPGAKAPKTTSPRPPLPPPTTKPSLPSLKSSSKGRTLISKQVTDMEDISQYENGGSGSEIEIVHPDEYPELYDNRSDESKRKKRRKKTSKVCFEVHNHSF